MLSGNSAYFLCIIAWLTVHVRGFSITQDTSLVNDETNTILVNSLNIDFDALENNQLFPETFRVNFVANGKSYSINFGRVPKDQNYPIGSANINILESGSTKKYKIDESEDEKFELYKEFDGLSIATLIKNNQYVAGQSDEDQFRILITIFDSYLGTSEIFPVSNHQGERRKRSVQRFTYIMQTRRVEDQNLVDQNYVKLIKSQIAKKSKRAAPDGQPFNLFVEVLLVADNTIYEDHIQFAGTNDTDLVFLYMRTYFAHYFNGINQRFQNSFTNDPDLRITIKLTNFLFLTTAADSFWSDPSLVGISSVSSYRGRQVITTNRTLEAFKNFMNSLSIPFNYDHAIGLFNKDLWEATGSNIEERSAVRGYSYVGTVCSDSRYSISEELGGFFYITVVARQIAQILGSEFDGGNDPTSSSCPSSENYLMTANIGGFSNILNQQRLSNCSILFIKNNLLQNNFGAVADNAQCLTNVPPNQPYDDYQNPGLFWTANDQCKMIYGPTATFCHDRNADMCLTLSCRVNSEATECTRTSGLGAAIGTVCDQGKMCSNGECEQNLQAPLDNCVFGDDVVVNLQVIPDPLPKNQLTCQETLDYLSSIGRFPYAYCNDPNFSKTCCQTCRKYSAINCVDVQFNCPSWISLCGSGAMIGGVSIDVLCPRTCNICQSQPIYCTHTNSLCQNGGICQNLTIPIEQLSDTVVGFECSCPTGYTGYMCEIKNPCLPNPCQNGGQCLILGSNGYVCQCPVGCTGYNCSTCLNTCTDSVCNFNGVCSEVGGEVTCTCNPNFTGETCATQLPCSQVTCLNGGTCVNQGINAVCNCVQPFTGPTCNITNDCFSNPCQNSGACVSQINGGYICFCIGDFTGTNCETPLVTISTITTTTVSTTTTSTTTTQTSSTSPSTTTTTSTTPAPITTSTTTTNTTPISPMTTTTSMSPTTTTTSMSPMTTTTTLTTQNQTCVDLQNNCPSWVAFCGTSIGDISINSICPLTCGVCPIGSTTTTTTTTSTTTTTTTTTTTSTTTTTTTPTTTSTTTLVTEECVDLQPNCATWTPFCDVEINGVLISSICPLSCGLCPLTTRITTPRITTTTTQQANTSNVCVPNPCQNQGICIALSTNTAVCQCSNAFTGFLCEFRNPCIDSPCSNGATCTIVGISANTPIYRCICPNGFTGSKCEININNQCTVSFCSNGGTCTLNPTTGLTTCICPPLYTGNRCEQVFNPCWNADNSPVCLNNAPCTINLGVPPYYQCLCPSGFFGTNCQFRFTTTTSIPATTPFQPGNGECIDTDEAFCQNYADAYCQDSFSVAIGTQRIPFVTYCRRSCNRCDSTSVCVDTQVACQNWPAFNLCSRLANIFPHPCPKSCGIC